MPSKEERTIKALFLDISRTLTGEGVAGKREVNPRAIAELAKVVRERGYNKIVFITALSGPSLLKGSENIFPELQKHGLLGKSEVYCESGLYRLQNIHSEGPEGKEWKAEIQLTPEAVEFQKQIRSARRYLNKALDEAGIQAFDASQKRGKQVQVRFEMEKEEERKDMAHNQRIEQILSGALRTLNLDKAVDVNVTGSGVNLQPKGMNKGIIAKRVMQGWALERTEKRLKPPRFRGGRAIGDFAPEDSLMAANPRIKFKLVSDVQHTINLFQSMTNTRFEGRRMRRAWRKANWEGRRTKKQRRLLRRR